jgi:predicted Co/Zn/Cd cation transporter (cation efflux family)
MNLKNAAFLALVGTLLTTFLLVYNLIFAILNVMRGLIPLDALISTLIYAIASVTVAVFFFVFHKQS